MIVRREKKNGIEILYVNKIKTEKEMEKIKNTLLKKNSIPHIITKDTDVYTDDNKLLLKFRKKKLPQGIVSTFYDNVINFAKKTYSTNRGSSSGSKKKNIRDNPKIYSNILGYIDGFSPKQKFLLKAQNKTPKYNVRETRFNSIYPDKFKQLIPFIQEVDSNYKKYIPMQYSKQIKKANQTHFRIPKTAFTTVTTNVNFQTSIHKDRGDDPEGFGNLTVIENNDYEGAETCLPQYGIGVDVRTGDVLFMNVHEWHGNLPMEKKNKDTLRLSIVCYLRYNVWKNTLKITKSEMNKHNKTIKNIKKQKTKIKNKK